MTAGDLDRFWRRVDKAGPNGCWVWTGGCSNTGYGSFSINGKNYATHRLSYAMHKGVVPVGAHVMHSCDRPRCVNPDHLFTGTHADNMRDKRAKGRAQRLSGALNGKTVVSADLAKRIYLTAKAGKLKQREIAELFGVSRAMVADIANRRSHRDVTEGL